ncbi:MAG: glucose-6-phosphate dehydrogenase assembly protein OpcA [candidate division KSB1 bacterium]|nr:glucose-6-phosphate dehydrogenase assembly protein OpcA [candidate division KSB1 bacterium]MDZ7273353.1 glucose-6-phosphate dehydrogenase assembly protein OpcA [candidate division KSB1 bacterium]MDZ7288015.1 glucose-6-phosphate dehydrogenase assembly protein OpcA [candidate division KSB1 bacterium]MDZ7300133.1 glucose-6-phosphate dehydrogenase assembly protein OpcA [candidate division KSB1 bacterium]MDZ7308479.1 glucose-6-phosphate dehydrogenase assembly protein OpcA [candidate division KSB1
MSAHSAATFIQGEKLSVDVAAIEKELTLLWQEVAVEQEAAGAATAAAAGRPVMRACTLNVMAIAPDDKTADQAAAAIAEFTSRHPCRALVVVADAESETEALSAYVSAHCHLPVPDAPQVCCEQITVIARGAAVAQVPGTVLPLLIGDLRVVLWWLSGLPRESALFEQLLGASDCLIFDSAVALDLSLTFAAANSLNANWRDGFLIDLNWLRLTQWRDLLARLFELAGVADCLQSIEKVTVQMSGGMTELEMSQPALLLGWLAAQLQWRLTEPFTATENGWRALWESAGREIRTEIVRVDNGKQAELTGLHLDLNHEGRPGALSITRRLSETTLTLQAKVSGFAERPEETPPGLLRLEEASLAALMARALDRHQREEVYEKALRKATQLL